MGWRQTAETRMIGPLANSAALILGGVIGAALSHRIPARARERMPLYCGAIAMSIGTYLFSRVHSMPVVAIAVLTGSILGELLGAERRVEAGLGLLRVRIQHWLPFSADDPQAETFAVKFATILALFSISAMGVFGSLEEGITGDPTILITKAILDFITAGIFATELGISVGLIAIPQFLVQVALLLSAFLIAPMVTPFMRADFSACGGVIMLATGMRICNIKTFPIINMLPGLLLAMPVSALWTRFFG